jgi:hypothetical protein
MKKNLSVYEKTMIEQLKLDIEFEEIMETVDKMLTDRALSDKIINQLFPADPDVFAKSYYNYMMKLRKKEKVDAKSEEVSDCNSIPLNRMIYFYNNIEKLVISIECEIKKEKIEYLNKIIFEGINFNLPSVLTKMVFEYAIDFYNINLCNVIFQKRMSAHTSQFSQYLISIPSSPELKKEDERMIREKSQYKTCLTLFSHHLKNEIPVNSIELISEYAMTP